MKDTLIDAETKTVEFDSHWLHILLLKMVRWLVDHHNVTVILVDIDNSADGVNWWGSITYDNKE